MAKHSTPNPARDAARKLAGELSKLSDEDRRARVPALPIVTIEGRALSPLNTILVATQHPTASVVGGFRQWLKAGRAVRKGERGAWIFVPTVYKGPGVNIITGGAVEEVTETRFVMAAVFDVSQTDEVAAEAVAAA